MGQEGQQQIQVGGGGGADGTQGEKIWDSLIRQKVKRGLLVLIHILWFKSWKIPESNISCIWTSLSLVKSGMVGKRKNRRRTAERF